MKYISLAIFIFILLVSIATSQATDLGNHNKQFTAPKDMVKSDWSNPDELERTWNAALVRIPIENGKYQSFVMKDIAEQSNAKKRHPTIIYLHGCSGIWQGTYTRVNFFAQSGYAVIAPVSFARAKYPQSCDIYKHKGGMYRHTLKMRQYDAAHAINNAKQLPWVDPNNVFLIGLSQGGVTTATLSSKDPNTSVNARVIEGWTCHAGWSEYKGINAPKDEPVLSIVGAKDPWFQNDWTRGHCGRFMKNEFSESVVFKKGYLSTRHELLEDHDVQKIVLDFIKKHKR